MVSSWSPLGEAGQIQSARAGFARRLAVQADFGGGRAGLHLGLVAHAGHSDRQQFLGGERIDAGRGALRGVEDDVGLLARPLIFKVCSPGGMLSSEIWPSCKSAGSRSSRVYLPPSTSANTRRVAVDGLLDHRRGRRLYHRRRGAGGLALSSTWSAARLRRRSSSRTANMPAAISARGGLRGGPFRAARALVPAAPALMPALAVWRAWARADGSAELGSGRPREPAPHGRRGRRRAPDSRGSHRKLAGAEPPRRRLDDVSAVANKAGAAGLGNRIRRLRYRRTAGAAAAERAGSGGGYRRASRGLPRHRRAPFAAWRATG